MKISIKIKKILKSFYFSLKRFPWAIAFAAATTLILIILVNFHSSYNVDTIDILKRVAMTLALGFPLLLSIDLIFERYDDFKKINKYLMKISSLILFVLYYFYLLSEINMLSVTRYFAITIALYLSVFIIHYFYKRNNFEMYIVHIFTRFFITIIYSAVMYIGLAAIFFTLNKLFNLPISSDLYLTAWLLVVGIFAPIFLLAGIPSYKHKLSIKDYPMFLKILILYIVLPIISVYTTILYLYFIKILIN